ncbi:MAG: phosphate acetyltransferase [Lachnospiraceae bacterium]|nr:phosphate acetyltransferase [Lachnospiraceae bacterium]
MDFIESIKERARQERKTIVLPEGMDKRTYEAAEIILSEDFVDLIILATPEEYWDNGRDYNVSKAKIINPKDYEKTEQYVDEFVELRKAKGITRELAHATLINDYMYYACMMVQQGDADGVVSGACHSSANTLRPSLQIIKTKPGTKLVSCFFLMVVPNKELGSNGTFVMGDCGLNQNPNSEELAAIAETSAESFKYLVGDEPKVAMLSHSTYGSASHPDVTKVREAVRIANRDCPNILIEGELQTDAAVVPEVAAMKAPNSKIAGKANVLIFPDLDAGNIGYKLIHRLGQAEAYGPLCQGIAKPVNDLSRGCSANDIVGVVAITAVQAQIK